MYISTNIFLPSMWNIQPSTQSPSPNASIVPEVKTEPFLSQIYYGGSYRNTYLTSPSPPPTSPMMNRYITTPSPNLMRNSNIESETQISNLYNQSQINPEQYQILANNFPLSTTITQGTIVSKNYNKPNIFRTTSDLFEKNNNNHFNVTNSELQQTHFAASNILVNRTSGGSFTPICVNDNASSINIGGNNSTNMQFSSTNVTNNIRQVQAVYTASNNAIFSQQQDSNTTSDSSLFNLSQLDDLVPLQNSDELRISNLSIST